MEESKDYSISDIGLPRANSNGAILIALILLAVFFVMAFSCSKRKNREKTNLGHPPQTISSNEWFNGRATGFSPPKPEPTQAPIEEKPSEIIKSISKKEKPPAKRLGGEIFLGSSSKNSINTKTKNNNETINQPSFEYYLDRKIEKAISTYEIKAGTSIPAQLDMSISSDLGGATVAHVTRNIYDSLSGKYVLIPQGTKLFGEILTNLTYGQTRVDVVWNRLIFPDSSSLVLNNMRASDTSGQTGLHHSVDNHLGRLYGGAILLSLISGGVQLSQNQENTRFTSQPSIGQMMAASLGQNLGQVSTELIRRQMDVRPTITVPAGEYFTIIVNKDLSFPAQYGAW